jgi:Family of unknown function (DUF5681)
MQSIALEKEECMQFQKGQSGNPAGRPRGSRNKATIRMQRKLQRKSGELVNKAVDLAMGGNVVALRLCLDRLLPACKNEPLVCETPPLTNAADAVAAIAGIASAAVAGDVTADQAAKLAKVISVYFSGLEAHEFEDRLVELERADLKRGARNAAPLDNQAGPPAMRRKADP